MAVKPANVSNSFRASGSQRNDRVASSRVNISCVLSSCVKTQPSNLFNFLLKRVGSTKQLASLFLFLFFTSNMIKQ